MAERGALVRIATILVSALVVAAATAPPALAARGRGACQEIAEACRGAGFVQGAAKSGNGLKVDCIDPIVHGTAAPRNASKPLPHIDPQLISACRASNPDARGAQAQDTGPPVPTVPAPPAPVHPAPPGSRNIVFVLTDDLALNLVQFMPHVLKMQKEGATFANYFVTDSLCCPSRTSIFTGRFPHDSGVFKNSGTDGGYAGFLSHGNEAATFAVSLSAGGYRTAMLGKYLNGYEPPQHPVGAGWKFWAVGGSTGYREFNYNLNLDGKVARYGDDRSDYLTDVLSDLSTRFVKQAAGVPFIIEVATYAPHGPYIPAPRDADAFPGLRAPRTPAFDAAADADAPSWLKNHPALTPKDIAKIDEAFRMRAQAVLAVDKMIGELQAALTATGQDKNTYFVFSSDNGYHMGEHRLMPGKMTPYDTDIRVPLIVTGPGVAPGRVFDEIVENIDLCPTFAELAGTTPALADGHSLVPLLHGQTIGEWRTAALIEHHGPRIEKDDPDAPAPRSGNPTTYEAIRLPNALYVEYADGTKEYHDLVEDPDELRNSFSLLPSADKAALGATLAAMRSCHDTQSCWIAARPAREVARK